MALFEETHYEPQTGHPINNNLADYCMAVNADTPEIDVTFLDYPDLVLNEYGARGVGDRLSGSCSRHRVRGLSFLRSVFEGYL
jgi:CO/xanthine dehydrogenase Mo-binding subunit